MVEEIVADLEEFAGCLGAADLVFEGFGVSLGDVNEVFFHLLDVFFFDKSWDVLGGLVVEFCDVIEDHTTGDDERGELFEVVGNLGKDPRIADGAAPDHETGGVGLGVEGEGGLEVDDVAVGDDGVGEGLDGLLDSVGVDGGLVSFVDGAGVDGEEVEGELGKNVEEGVEFVVGLEADAGFDGEGEGWAGVAEF